MTLRLYSNLMRAGQSHAGIILAAQQRYSVGEQMRRLLRLINALTAEDMIKHDVQQTHPVPAGLTAGPPSNPFALLSRGANGDRLSA